MGEDPASGPSGDRPFSSEPSLDTIFGLLAEERRRYVIRILADHGPSVSLPDLADEVAAREFAVPITEIDDREILFIYLALYHRHIPKLAAAGVLEYDQDRDLVTVAENADRLEQFLLLGPGPDRDE